MAFQIKYEPLPDNRILRDEPGYSCGEEDMTAGVLEIWVDGVSMILCRDEDGTERDPILCGSYLAEWFVNYWWNHRYVSEESSYRGDDEYGEYGLDYAFAHRMTGIGNGYQWPYVEITGDGEFVYLESKRDEYELPPNIFYLGCDEIKKVPLAEYDHAVESFINQILGILGPLQLGRELEIEWSRVCYERNSPELVDWIIKDCRNQLTDEDPNLGTDICRVYDDNMLLVYSKWVEILNKSGEEWYHGIADKYTRAVESYLSEFNKGD